MQCICLRLILSCRNGSEKNETLPVMYEGILLSEARISAVATKRKAGLPCPHSGYYVEYCERKIFSKKFNICGVSIPSNNNIDIHTPGEQNRLYIIHCGTGLVNVSLSIGIVVETVGIDAILLLGHAISLKPKSIRPGHLLLPNSVVQHDLCHGQSCINIINAMHMFAIN